MYIWLPICLFTHTWRGLQLHVQYISTHSHSFVVIYEPLSHMIEECIWNTLSCSVNINPPTVLYTFSISPIGQPTPATVSFHHVVVYGDEDSCFALPVEKNVITECRLIYLYVLTDNCVQINKSKQYYWFVHKLYFYYNDYNELGYPPLPLVKKMPEAFYQIRDISISV